MHNHQALFQVIADLKRTVIRYPQFDQAYQQIETVLTLKRSVNIAQHLLCIGAAGTGKSTLKREIEKVYPRIETKNHPLIPVLVVDTPAIPTVKNVAESMLVQLGDPLADKGSAINKTVRILSYLELCNVELLIFDELQHFIDQGKKNTPYQVADWLKSLIDQANIPTVLMGLERSEQILKINEQLRRRFNRRIHLTSFPIDTKEEYQIFAGVIMKLLSLIPTSYALNLQDIDLLNRIHYATNGIIDYIVKLILSAYEIALENGSALDQTILGQAFKESIWMDCSHQLNPFHTDFKWIRLDKMGMPFHLSIV